MALNNFKSNYLMPLHFKGLIINNRIYNHETINHLTTKSSISIAKT